MVAKKNKSKRVKLSAKYKIQKKVREHHKQLRRQARKDPQLRKKLSKDPGVPNLWTMKEALIQKLSTEKRGEHEHKKTEEQNKQKKKTEAQRLAEMQQNAAKRNNQYENKEELQVQGPDSKNVQECSKWSFFKEFKKVVKSADVILEVLDARDPLGSRSPTIERQILEMDPNKKIILVLNKVDLIPKSNMLAWLTYLRNEYPAVGFKCSTQKISRRGRSGRGHVQMSNATDEQIQGISQCIGAETLLSLLKNYARSLGGGGDVKRNINVGIIGFPNVGKSSLINSLKREKSVNVGAKAGLTRRPQEVFLDKNITLIDCPGIIFATDMSESDAALRNAINTDQLSDFTLPVQAILHRCSNTQLAQLYKIPAFSDANDFLRHISIKRGKLKQGGVIDIESSARAVLQDWNTGKIPYFTIPPEAETVHLGASIVKNWSEAFKLPEIVEIEKSELGSLNNEDANFVFASAVKSTTMKPDAMFSKLDNDEDVDIEGNESEDNQEMDDESGSGEESGDEGEGDEDEDQMEVEKKPTTQIAPAKEKSAQKNQSKARVVVEQRSTEMKKQFKAQQKEKKKASVQTAAPTEDYDFGRDFWAGSSTTTATTNATTTTTTSNDALSSVNTFSF